MSSTSTDQASELLLHQLAFPKFLLKEARRVMQRPGPYYRGLATSILQDAAEALLRIVAVERKLNVRDRDGFEKVLDHVAKQIESVGDHRASLSRLNGARIMFKHQRLSSVQENDIIVFYGNVESFLIDVCRDVLNIDFGTVSLANAIRHRRTQNWIEKAEQALAAGEIDNSVDRASRAMAIYLAHDNKQFPRHNRLPSPTAFDRGEGLGSIEALANWTREKLVHIDDRLNLMARGVDVVSFDKFTSITPRVLVGVDGSIQSISFSSTPLRTADDARFCIDSVIDIALALQSNQPPPSLRRIHVRKSKVKVVQQAEIVVNTRQDPPEIIRIADPNEELYSPVAEPLSLESDHVSVFQDDDVAYVRKDCVEEVAPGPE